jgi:hypothetical protein
VRYELDHVFDDALLAQASLLPAHDDLADDARRPQVLNNRGSEQLSRERTRHIAPTELDRLR